MPAAPLFRFTQFELPWALGPPDGRYLVRDGAASEPTHVLVLATLGAPERRWLPSRKLRNAEPEPEPSPVATARATAVEVTAPFADRAQADAWLRRAGEADLAAGLAVLNRVLRAHRLAASDAHANAVAREQALVARVGFGAGEQVADGQWEQAREVLGEARRRRRVKALAPDARLAAILAGRDRELVCEELALRARLDLNAARERAAALQVLVALDAALAELPGDPAAATLAERLTELRAQRDAIAVAAQAALAGALAESEREAVAFTLGRIEAALRARAVAAR